jgi:hypothetical protein
MSKSLIILIVAVAVAAGILIGRYAIHPSTPQARSVAGQGRQDQKGAAAAASRAMTFTQPRMPDH